MSSKKQVIGFGSVEVAESGHRIGVALRLADGSEEVIQFGQELLAQFVQGLLLAGQSAEKARKAQPGTMIEIAHMHHATAVRSGRSDQEVVLRFSTTLGVPVDMSMHPNLAMDTIQQIGKALAMPARKPTGQN